MSVLQRALRSRDGKGNKAALLLRAAGLPPLLHGGGAGAAPALLPACPCHAGPVLAAASLRLTSANKAKDLALGSELTREARVCLFSLLSVGQGLCCWLPCCWLQRSAPREPEPALSRQFPSGRDRCWRHRLLEPGEHCRAGLVLSPAGLCCNCLSV